VAHEHRDLGQHRATGDLGRLRERLGPHAGIEVVGEDGGPLQVTFGLGQAARHHANCPLQWAAAQAKAGSLELSLSSPSWAAITSHSR